MFGALLVRNAEILFVVCLSISLCCSCCCRFCYLLLLLFLLLLLLLRAQFLLFFSILLSAAVAVFILYRFVSFSTAHRYVGIFYGA